MTNKNTPLIPLSRFWEATAKSQGPVAEAVAASSFPANLRASWGGLVSRAGKLKPASKKKEGDGSLPFTSITREAARVRRVVCLLREASDGASSQLPSRFRVVLIQEGLGNMADGHYYTSEALQKAASLFEGKKCFINHSTEQEEATRPERSVEDVTGHYEHVRAARGEDGLMELQADLVIPRGKAFEKVREQLVHALEYSKKFPDKNFVGLSISASGSSKPVRIEEMLAEFKVPPIARRKLEEALQRGLYEVKLVEEITDALSCDLVTEPGAGGKVVEAIT